MLPFSDHPSVKLAWDTILRKRTTGIPSCFLHVMQHDYIERLAGTDTGIYRRNPHEVYIRMQQNLGTCLLDQYLAENPLTMEYDGFNSSITRTATTGLKGIILDGIPIRSPESVVEHLETVEFPSLHRQINKFDFNSVKTSIIQAEVDLQQALGSSILKCPYGVAQFPVLDYGSYGYVHYFQAYAQYPDVIEKHFRLQADLAVLQNRTVAYAIQDGNLPPLIRLDHDMADSRGTLVSLESLDRIWFPHFTRSIQPLLDANIRLIWHCDGNLMGMVPRLIEVGLSGFQGFQYEDGMDYDQICRMKTRDGESLIIIAGVSVTRTLPFGGPSDVRHELKWLMENGPPTGLFLGASSSILPGTPWENLETLVEGLQYYQHRRR